MKPVSSTLIEGFGDEAVYGISVLIAIVVSITLWTYRWIQNRGTLHAIHQENQATVNTVREEITNTRTEDNQSRSTQRSQPGTRMPDRDITCPICLTQAQYAIETNCGHIFCGQCMTTYWRHGNWINGLKCPVCRSMVTIFLRYFTADEQSTQSQERDDIVREINHYNRRYSGEPIPWMDRLRDLPTLLRHLGSEFFSVGGLVIVFRLRILVLFSLAVLYFISPLDLIPEAVFGFLGLIDDLFILFLLAIYLSIMYRQYIANRAEN